MQTWTWKVTPCSSSSPSFLIPNERQRSGLSWRHWYAQPSWVERSWVRKPFPAYSVGRSPANFTKVSAGNERRHSNDIVLISHNLNKMVDFLCFFICIGVIWFTWVVVAVGDIWVLLVAIAASQLDAFISAYAGWSTLHFCIVRNSSTCIWNYHIFFSMVIKSFPWGNTLSICTTIVFELTQNFY